MDIWTFLKAQGRCGICEQPLATSKHCNFVALDKKATWAYPTWGNILVPGSEGRAQSVVCDSCIEDASGVKKALDPKYAIEVSAHTAAYSPLGVPETVYDGITDHPVKGLEDVPAITEEMVTDGERRMRGR